MTRYLRIDDHHQALLVVLALRQFGSQASLKASPGKAADVAALTERARSLCLSEAERISFAAILPEDAPSGTYRLIHTSDQRFSLGYALLDRENPRPLADIAAQLCGNLSLDPLPRAQPVEHIERRGYRLVGAQAPA